MKSNKFTGIFVCFLMLLSVDMHAQLNLPRGSQQATVSQRIGITDIYIKYSRPSVRNREVWGKLVPYGMNDLRFGTAKESPWRAGANENTIVKFTDDVSIEGKPLKAGKYGLHMVISEDNTATIIFSKNYTAWGSFFYNPKEDALRVNVKAKTIPFVEQLTFDFTNVDATSAIASLKWEKKQIPFKIEVDVTKVVLEDIRKKLQDQPGFSRQTWEQAANFSLNNGGDLNEALVWIDKAIAGQFFSQKTFNNLSIKAQILNKLGRVEEYGKLMDEAASMANINQLNRLGYTMINAKDYARAIKYLKRNVANNPTSANAYDSLGEAYKEAGDKKNAVKALKKSLSLNPPANVKANSEKLLRELGEM
ncbi:DUF2911 domain-containing protein [Tenacibaculum caenipelagi]|uniref:Tetratricopeptide repeat protein n=1 Tax=Tenacibaculum caenipelagi TaxID=1325435 RepID=A0A4R6TEL3_9FLAO|nr:DUF2911 domain-containing protein [Tenacibaculum caenipelagi]TDQ27823.1 tetratricopeptide repeat protein [Tenacibaculum caenipelagi]